MGKGWTRPQRSRRTPPEALCMQGGRPGWGPRARALTFTRCFLCCTLSSSSSSSLSSSSQFCRKGICSSTEPPKRSLLSLPAAFLPRTGGQRGCQSCQTTKLGWECAEAGGQEPDPRGALTLTPHRAWSPASARRTLVGPLTEL